MKKTLFVAGGMLWLAAAEVKAYQCSVVTAAVTLTPPPVTLQRDLPVGSAIGNEVLSGVVPTYRCSNTPPPALTYQSIGVKAYGTYVTTIAGRRIYSTNIAGIGYALGGTPPNTCSGTELFVGANFTTVLDGTGDGNVNNAMLCLSNGVFPVQPVTMQARIQFYKTAHPTGSGTVSIGQAGSFILQNDRQVWFSPEIPVNMAAFDVTTVACSVTNTAITVPMGTVERRAFSGPGTWPGDENTRSFNIALNCDSATRVNLQIDGSAENATQGILNLTGGAGSATGVGIQLIYNNVPLPLSGLINTGTLSYSGLYNIPLQARYYQTGSEVTTGQANASATFTLIYQ